MVAAEGPQVFREGIPESSIDPTLEFIIQNYYTPAGEVWAAVNSCFCKMIVERHFSMTSTFNILFLYFQVADYSLNLYQAKESVRFYYFPNPLEPLEVSGTAHIVKPFNYIVVVIAIMWTGNYL